MFLFNCKAQITDFEKKKEKEKKKKGQILKQSSVQVYMGHTFCVNLTLQLPHPHPPRAPFHVVGMLCVYVKDMNQPSLPTLFFLFCSCVYFCLSGPFNCISFHKLSGQLSALSLCSSCLNSAILVFSTICLFMKIYLSP